MCSSGILQMKWKQLDFSRKNTPCLRCLQAGTDGNDWIWGVDITDDGAVILAGDTAGDWAGTNAGEDDFAAVKLSADGVEEWRWQVRCHLFFFSGGGVHI